MDMDLLSYLMVRSCIAMLSAFLKHQSAEWLCQVYLPILQALQVYKKYSCMVHSVNKNLGNLRLPLSAFDAGKLVDCVATSFLLMAWVPKIQYCTIALYKH